MTADRAASLAEAPWLRAGALPRLFDALDGDGEEARVIGGAVRNALIGAPIGDIDIATTALPEEVIRRVEAQGFKAVPTGIAHGTLTVVVDGAPFEVTTLREDVETFGRHARVVFGRDWAADAARRDFTINALSLSRDGTVHDPVGGLADIAARRVRFIGEPGQRIAEDYLRILRFFRFQAFYGEGRPDAEGLAACIRGRAGLDTLARERVRMEMMKLVVGPHAAPTLATMSEAGILGQLLAGIGYLASFEMTVKIEAVLGLAPDAARRLAALAAWIVEDADRLLARLRLSGAEHARIRSVADRWWRIDPASEREGRALLYRLGEGAFTDRVIVAWARSAAAAHDHVWRAVATLPRRWSPPAFPVKAEHLIRRGVARGPALGRALAAMEEAWIAADFPQGEAALAALVDETVAAAAKNQKD